MRVVHPSFRPYLLSDLHFGLRVSYTRHSLDMDAHGYGRRFIVRGDEILTAFVELERAIHAFALSLIGS